MLTQGSSTLVRILLAHHQCCAVIAEHPLIGIEIAEFQNAWTAGGEAASPDPLLEALEPVLGTG